MALIAVFTFLTLVKAGRGEMRSFPGVKSFHLKCGSFDRSHHRAHGSGAERRRRSEDEMGWEEEALKEPCWFEL